ncbi:dipeptide transport system permease DppB [Klebsiella variicola]|uniref:Dipeptide transport system permease DppB n=1 Tax=Klebsiella variicola TaxID=244366 RepID=A0A7H4MGF4_KLEVA|nr:dipeptide transport system permease DppB [Klebsiella variicola]
MVRQQLGLTSPLHVQFWHYITNVLRGDFGISMASRRPVSSEIASRFMPTLWLTLASMSWAVLFGMAAGDRGRGVAQSLARPSGNGAGGERHFVSGFCSRHAADAGVFG